MGKIANKIIVFVISMLIVITSFTGTALAQDTSGCTEAELKDLSVAMISCNENVCGAGGVNSGTDSSVDAGETFVAWNSGLQPTFIMEQYVIEVLKYIADYKKLPRDDVVTEQHTQALLAFALGEGGDIANSSTFNLFNTSALRDDPSAMPYAAGGADGRLAYASFDVGIKATGGTMLLPRYTRIIDALTKKDSTAEQVLYNYTHYSEFPGNNWWAQKNETDGENVYYSYEINFLKQVRDGYKTVAATVIGTPAKEKNEGLRDPSKLVYSGGGTTDTSIAEGSSGSGGASCTCSTTNGADASASDNPQTQALSFYISKGLTREQAAGIVGNLVIESGENIDPSAVSGSGTFHGIAQWGSSVASGERWQALQAWAVTNSKPVEDRNTQLEFSWFELTNGYKSTYEKIKASTTVKDATVIFLNEYEGAAGQHEADRIKAAEKALESAPADSGSTTSSTCASGAGGVAVVNGFTFPLKTTKTAIKTGANGAIWCLNSQTNCHHDYNAADIHVAVGTTVIAAKEGTVQMSKDESSSCGSSVVIIGSDKQVYYYTHMQLGSIKVTKGQSVTGGQELGRVGDKACGSAPHLHFDMQPPPQTIRPNCSGAKCVGYTFLNVQPVLTKSYEALPE